MITSAQIATAQAVQHAAAHDNSNQVRLVAGPGSGKSASIEERVCWLLGQGAPLDTICAVSFTRAASTDLRLRIHQACTAAGVPNATSIRVTTLHSLGLRLLRAAGQLGAYPVEPLVLDPWELEEFFDAEFGCQGGHSKSRREAIRRYHEAYWSTGSWNPANYIPPNPPITGAEQTQFNAFHGPRTQTYACVLPGEIIRQCVTNLQAGLINPVELLNIRHLIIDEFQDLNPLDLQFVDFFIAAGVRLFVAGDDDQSVYSFRFAEPAGLQQFPTKYAGTGQHQLSACFRCPPAVLGTATTLMAAFPSPGRIPKNQHSLYVASTPPVNGSVHRWRFASARQEATAIAESCRDLLVAGMMPRDILILLSNGRALSKEICDALTAAKVPFENPREDSFLDSEAGRLTLALVRIVCDSEDYVALRAVLGVRNGVGVATCHLICDSIIANNLNYRDVFYNPLPAGVFAGRLLNALNHARTTCVTVAGWNTTDTLNHLANDIAQVIQSHLDPTAAASWHAFRAVLPGDTTIEELRDFLWADSDEQQITVLEAIMDRLGIPRPTAGVLPPRVRIMSMHGAKGLSARAVFIPGLEEEIFPGQWRVPYPGLVLEAARLLYVSITRARAACMLSFATSRMMNGNLIRPVPARFAAHLAGAFVNRVGGLNPAEVAQILGDCANL